jgi:hypothetical protein
MYDINLGQELEILNLFLIKVPTIYRTRGEHANHYATDAVAIIAGLALNNNHWFK